MLKAQFIEMIRAPHHLDSTQVAELESIVKEYPFFESAHLLYTKGLHQYNALNYARQLRKTAIVANSRAVLYELLNPRVAATVQTPIAKPEVPVEEIPDETVSETKPLISQDALPEEEVATEPEQIKPLNPVSITSDEIKVVYVTTVPSAGVQSSIPVLPTTVEQHAAEEEQERVEEKVIDTVREEIGIIQAIENETQAPEPEVEAEPERELNREIGREISRSIIQSYIETEVIKTPELQKPEPEKPLSFTDWLNRVKTEAGTISKTSPKEEEKELPVQESQELPEKAAKPEKKSSNIEQNKNIIDKIIEADPGRIKLGSNKFFTPASDAKQSLLENEHLVTETLAKIYALQGNISKAIRAYEILSLKFPQKSVYFASLIEKLKK